MDHSSGPEPLVRRPRLGAGWQTVAAGIVFTLLVVAAAYPAWLVLRTYPHIQLREE